MEIPQRLGRLLVVLALIVALLCSSIPVPARAVGAGVLYNIAANFGVNLALRAIGVGPGNSPEDFNNLVSTIGEAVSSATAPFAQLLITGFSGNFRSFLSADFLSWVLSWLFDSGTVSSSQVDPWLSGTTSFSYGSSSVSVVGDASASYYVCSVATPSLSRCLAIYSSTNSRFRIEVDGVFNQFADLRMRDTGLYFGYFYVTEPSDFSWASVNLPYHYFSDIDAMWNFTPLASDSIVSDIDVSLDNVGESLDSAPYSGWVGQSVSNDDHAFVPVSVPSLDSSTISAQTQTQAQAGTIPDTVVDEIIAGEDVVPDTGTIADVITSIRALGADIVAAVQAIPAAIADIFSLAAGPEVYQVDLKDFFPFCIPFDLFDIVSAFAAEPEAPVFEWPISVPRWGFEYTLKVDLQEWEDIASLFRTLELTIFCVGLAIVTREKFLRS